MKEASQKRGSKHH